jgi:hypothetical protein
MPLSKSYEPHFLVYLHFSPAVPPNWHTVAIAAALPQDAFVSLLESFAALDGIQEISRNEQGNLYIATLAIAQNWKLDDQTVQKWVTQDVTQFNEETQLDEVIQQEVLQETVIDGVKTTIRKELELAGIPANRVLIS